MLTNEEIEKEMNELTSLLSENGIEPELVYAFKKEFPVSGSSNQGEKPKVANGFVAGLAKQPFATYPMIGITLVNRNEGFEVGHVYFQSQNKAGFKLQDYKFSEVANAQETFYPIENLKTFLSDIELTGIDFSIYENQKENLEKSLKSINEILSKKK